MKQKAFTLIELLVVIAIIGVIASIVLVNLSGTREKASIARNLQFSQSIYRALGSEAAGAWDFNNLFPGNKVRDITGNNNDGTLINEAHLVEGSIGNLGKSLDLDGTIPYDEVNAGRKTSLNVASGQEMTVEAWVNLRPPAGRLQTVVAKWTPWIFFISASNKMVFYIRYGSEDRSVSANTALIAGRWYHVVNVYTRSNNRVWFYLNGQEDGSPFFTSPITMNNDSNLVDLRIGYYGNPNTVFNGQIDDVRIYGRALTSSEIKKHYVEGLANYQLVENK